MASDGSVTHWIEQLRAGDRDAAAHALWERYFGRLVHFARHKLKDTPRRVEDEEDVALSAFKSFCEAAKKGRIPDLNDRECLWQFLLWITARKAVDRIRHYDRQKRRVKGESVLFSEKVDFTDPGLSQVIGDAPTPEFAAIAVEEYQRLLSLLNDPQLESIAVAKMEGYTNKIIAKQLGYSVCTIERRLHLIRKIWEQESIS